MANVWFCSSMTLLVFFCFILMKNIYIRRLYDLSIHKDLSAGEMHALGWGEDGEAWRWRRRLLAWEEELVVEIRNLLTNVTLQDTEPDVWLWRPNIGDGYTVRGVYQMLMRQEMHNHDVVSDAPWHRVFL